MPDAQNTTGTDNQPQGGQGFPADNRDGTPSLIGKDAFTVKYETEKLNRGHTTVLAGNYADLQRLGAQIATGSINPQKAIAAPPGVDVKDDSVITPAQHDALKGEYTVESAREGLVEAPVPPKPADNNEPNSVDPTSTSPSVEAKGKSTTTTTTSTSPKPVTK
jgi:hypothetical protein